MSSGGYPDALREVATWITRAASRMDEFTEQLMPVITLDTVWSTEDGVAAMSSLRAETRRAAEQARELEDTAKLILRAADILEYVDTTLKKVADDAHLGGLVEIEERAFLAPYLPDPATYGPIVYQHGYDIFPISEDDVEYERVCREIYDRKAKIYRDARAQVLDALRPMLDVIVDLDDRRQEIGRSVALLAADYVVGSIQRLAERYGSGLFTYVSKGAPLFSLGGAAYALHDGEGLPRVLASQGSGFAVGVALGVTAKVVGFSSGPLGWVALGVGIALSGVVSHAGGKYYDRNFATEAAWEKLNRLEQR